MRGGILNRMRAMLQNGAGAVLVVLIMFIGSLGLWVGTPLLWLYVGSQIQGATESIGAALAAMFVGVIITVTVLASLLAKLSDVYRANCLARGQSDPGPRDARGRPRGQRRPDPGRVRDLVLPLRRRQPGPARESTSSHASRTVRPRAREARPAALTASVPGWTRPIDRPSRRSDESHLRVRAWRPADLRGRQIAVAS